MSNQTGIKKQILKELAKNKLGLTNFELSEKLGLTKQQVNDSLRESMSDTYVSKGENLGVEGVIYSITQKGLSYSKSEKVVESVAAQIVEESPLEQIEESVSFRHHMTADSFQIWQIIDEAGVKFKQLLDSKQLKLIENIDYKIETLRCLSDIHNEKISATLREIAMDLRAQHGNS